MKSLSRYAVANTVVRARLSNLLTGRDFESIAQAGSLEDAWGVLTRTSYGEILPAWSGQSVYEIDALLHNASGRRFQDAARPLRDPAGGAGAILLSRWDLDVLEYALRLWHAGEPGPGNAGGYGTFVNSFSPDAVTALENLEDAVQLLKHTPFARPIQRASEDYAAKHSLFPVENALERDYYRRLFDALNRLGGQDGRDARAMIGAEVDLLNLACLARLLNYYDVIPEDFHAYVIPSGSPASKRLLQRGMSVENIFDLLTRAMAGVPGAAGPQPAPVEQISLLENALNEIMSASARRALVGYPFSFKSVLAFYILTRIELRALRSLIAAKNMGPGGVVPPESRERR